MKLATFCSNKEFSCNVYVLSHDNDVLLIDPGYFTESIVQEINSNGTLTGILITHGHFDHVQALDRFLKLFKVPVYLYKTEEMLLADSRYNCSTLLTGEEYFYRDELTLLDQGKIQIGKFNIEVILTDGHTPGSCSFYFPDFNAIFVGDFIIGYSIGRTDLPGGNMNAMIQSLQRFKKLDLSPETFVFSGHEAPHKYETLIKRNPFIK